MKKHSKPKSKIKKILNDTFLAAKYHKFQLNNVETSGQKCEAIEIDNNISLVEKYSIIKEVKNTSSILKYSDCKFKANQLNEEIIEVSNQEFEAKEAIKILL
ncbi:unnamed protein product [Rhizophagus irregularis]|nr:unnamed protein product [Rhizophagus irregularis]